MISDTLKGYKNTGWENTGSMNSGDGNSGDYNQGDYNSGHRNYGSYNTGDFNIGDFNSGDWNQASGTNGVFCTEAQTINFFNKPSAYTLEDWRKTKACQILGRIRTTKWIPRSVMTLQERLRHTDYRQSGGYLKTMTMREACADLWHGLTPEERADLMAMPNFDPDIFQQVTGLDVGDGCEACDVT